MTRGECTSQTMFSRLLDQSTLKLPRISLLAITPHTVSSVIYIGPTLKATTMLTTSTRASATCLPAITWPSTWRSPTQSGHSSPMQVSIPSRRCSGAAFLARSSLELAAYCVASCRTAYCRGSTSPAQPCAASVWCSVGRRAAPRYRLCDNVCRLSQAVDNGHRGDDLNLLGPCRYHTLSNLQPSDHYRARC